MREEAKNEAQNLFVQVINGDMLNLKNREEPYPREMFIGGTDSTGFTSFNVGDSNDLGVYPHTNYGVTWLTNYNDNSVVSPQIVEVNDKIVVLWTYEKNIYINNRTTGLGEIEIN